jgi:hypothetical protein
MHPIRGGADDRVFAIADGAVTAVRSRAAVEAGERRVA